MNKHINSFALTAIFAACLLINHSGCGSSDVADLVAENNKTHIQKVANAYSLYEKRLGKAVTSKEELIEFVQSGQNIAKNLEFMNIDPSAFPDYFVSERDDEEFFIRWGISVPDRTAAQPLVFEKTGVDGLRQVCFSNSVIEEVDANQYDKWKSRGVKKGSFEQPDIDTTKNPAAGTEG